MVYQSVLGTYPSLFDELAAKVKPTILADDMTIISQAVDFIGVNYYTAYTTIPLMAGLKKQALPIFVLPIWAGKFTHKV